MVTFWHGIRSFGMMKHMVTLFLSLAVFAAKADSPLTSTSFAKSYLHVKAVKDVVDQEVRTMGEEQIRFLDDTTASLDEKIALINAMGWGDSTRFDVYKLHISKKYGLKLSLIDSIITFRGPQPTLFAGTEKITAEDLCCMAYFRAMTDYLHPLTSYYCAYIAVDKKPGSMAASYVFGLILSQVYLNLDWCRLYETMQAIKTFDGYNTDSLREDAVTSIFSYIEGYKESCKAEEEKIVQEPLYKKPDKRQVSDKKNYVDLSVVDVSAPEFDEENSGTIVRVQILNSGTVASIETNASMLDLDIIYAEAKKLGLKGEPLKVIKDNNEAARKGDSPVNEESYLEEGIDYDPDFEIFQRIPPVKPGEIVTITFTLKKYWVYDPNCEIEIKIDLDNNIEEKNEKNNSGYFIAFG